MERTQVYALSIKQPWATLLVHGHKTVEVRGWSTQRRGRVLIHAGRVPDRREQAWAQVPANLKEKARLLGGIVGEAELTDCLRYTSAEAFAADRPRHLNDPGWFRAPRLYGFTFANSAPLPFRRYRGALFFFPVDGEPSEGDKVTR
jgi:hypothetical protein